MVERGETSGDLETETPITTTLYAVIRRHMRTAEPGLGGGLRYVLRAAGGLPAGDQSGGRQLLTSLYHVQIPVRDLDAAVAWYEKYLGFTVAARPGGDIAFLNSEDGPFLMLWRTDDPERANFTVAGEPFPVLLYRTTQIHQLHDGLASSGATITTYQDDGHHWVLKFFDPDGNMWGALQDN
ncbi:VOC family protein [Actinopolymorpha sp. NPDC004070]|uniref:VOC family protein n=1 Tax=Actinopolymorpha sp. NPDC004070 TaxID=3154548 RepID=UPI0033BA1A10